MTDLPDPAGTIDWDVALPMDARQRRETFARYGAAMYRAQCVEKQLAILLATSFEPGFLAADEETRDVYFEREFKKTLGALLTRLRRDVDVSPSMDDRLSRGYRLRNWLAHEYFWEHARDVLTPEGRETMIAELQTAADFLADLDADLTAVSDAWLSVQGIDPEQFEQEYRRELPTADGDADRSDPRVVDRWR